MFDIALESLPPAFEGYWRAIDSAWRVPTRAEIEEYLLDILTKVHDFPGPRSRDENLEAFEKGWTQNLEEALIRGGTRESLRPRYFRETKYLRYDRTLIVSENLQLEYDLFVLARMAIFSKYLQKHPVIYEFGCGSCANLLMLAELFPDKHLVGLDWSNASQDIANFLARKGKLRIRGEHFDFFHPRSEFVLESGAAVLTIHALEQLGDRFGPWLDLLMQTKPSIVVNYEPVLEFYDPNNLWDFLALLYSRKRGYLSGYLPTLQRLADEGQVEILEARRPYLGGVVHEASLIVWRPI
ncbi:MAG: hypothetical protein ACLQPD_05700 [Desulfomonilaceae bacterium]